MTLVTRKILAVEVTGDQIQAALMTKKGKRLEIADFIRMERPNPEDELPAVDSIMHLAARLGYPSGPSVFVTPLARAVEISLNRKKIERMKQYQLTEAVRWEVEPYTGVSGIQALVGALKADQADHEPGVIAEPEDEDITVNVSVLERNVYRAIKERFKGAGLKLVRIYPPDVCFYMPLFMEKVEAARAVLDIGQDYANFAILKGELPFLINTFAVSREAILEHLGGTPSPELEESLKFIAGQVPPPLPLQISGVGALDRKVVDYLSSLCAQGAEPIKLSKTARLTEAGHDNLNAVYATAAGAAIRELQGGKTRLIGISDSEPLIPRLKKSAYLMPLAVTIVLVVTLFGHYLYMKQQKSAYKERIKTLTAELKKKKDALSEYEKTEQKVEKLKEEIETTKKKIAFIRGGSDDGLEQLMVFLNSFNAIPQEMVLERIEQKNDGEYSVFGSSSDLRSVGTFAVSLQTREWCRSVVVKALEDAGDGHLDFNLTVLTNKP